MVSTPAPVNAEQAATVSSEAIRSACVHPVLQAALGTGLIQVVALQYYAAADWQKGLLAATSHGGLLLAPLTVLVVARARLTVARAIAVHLLAATVGLLVAAVSTNVGVFIGGIALSIPLVASTAPLTTALWRDNVDAAQRGRLFARIAVIGTISCTVIGLATSVALEFSHESFRVALVVFAGLLLIAARRCWHLPSQRLAATTVRNPLAKLGLLWQDKLFGYISLSWMLIGFANLATLPLRVEHTGSAERGLGLSPGLVLILTQVLPLLATLLSTPLWGRLFDRINFLALRITINLCFALSLLSFFTASMPLMIVGAICFGLGAGGGSVAWHLWTTKYAPPERTADYMAVHSFLTGCRGLVGPQVALWACAAWSIRDVTYVGVGLIVVAIALLLPILRFGNR
ncbi:MAG: MFS transporter [Planctomycetota bacterium]